VRLPKRRYSPSLTRLWKVQRCPSPVMPPSLAVSLRFIGAVHCNTRRTSTGRNERTIQIFLEALIRGMECKLLCCCPSGFALPSATAASLNESISVKGIADCITSGDADSKRKNQSGSQRRCLLSKREFRNEQPADDYEPCADSLTLLCSPTPILKGRATNARP
jgi:hypothetical protein